MYGGGPGPSRDTKNPKEKKKTVVRVAGGTVWEDSTLLEWDPSRCFYKVSILLKSFAE